MRLWRPECVFQYLAYELVRFQYGFYKLCHQEIPLFTDLPNQTNASQKDKCDVLELYKNDSIKHQASKRLGESAVFQKRFSVKISKRPLIELFKPLQWFITCFVQQRYISRIDL